MSRGLYILIFVLCLTCTLFGQDTVCISRDIAQIQFKKKGSKLTAIEKSKLDSLVSTINKNPFCVILATSYSADLCKKCGALSWDRQNAVMGYLLSKGVDEYRLTSYTELTGNSDIVKLSFSNWDFINRLVEHPRSKK